MLVFWKYVKMAGKNTKKYHEGQRDAATTNLFCSEIQILDKKKVLHVQTTLEFMLPQHKNELATIKNPIFKLKNNNKKKWWRIKNYKTNWAIRVMTEMVLYCKCIFSQMLQHMS